MIIIQLVIHCYEYVKCISTYLHLIYHIFFVFHFLKAGITLISGRQKIVYCLLQFSNSVVWGIKDVSSELGKTFRTELIWCIQGTLQKLQTNQSSKTYFTKQWNTVELWSTLKLYWPGSCTTLTVAAPTSVFSVWTQPTVIVQFTFGVLLPLQFHWFLIASVPHTLTVMPAYLSSIPQPWQFTK